MKKLLGFLPALLFYGLIFLGSSRPLPLRLPGGGFDKIPHAAEFAVLGFLISLGFFRAAPANPGPSARLTFLIGALLGAADEFHQKFVAGRSSDPLDAAADAVGVLLGIALFRLYLRKRNKSAAG